VNYALRSYGFGYCLTLLSLGVLAEAGRADDRSDLLSLLRAGHRSARESIRSLAATISVTATFPEKKLIHTGRYWRRMHVVRVHEDVSVGAAEDWLLRDFEVRGVGTSQGKRGQLSQVAARKPPSDMLSMCDIWSEMYIDWGPSGGQFEFDRFLEFAKAPPQVTRETLDGVPCIRLSLIVETSGAVEQHVLLWHDVTRNYLVRKMEVTYTKSDSRSQAEIEFVESRPGVFVPIRCDRKSYRNGKQVSGRQTNLSDLHVNEPISEDTFTLPAIRSGTVLQDWIAMTICKVDADWRPMSKPRPFSGRMGVPGQADAAESAYDSQSTHEAGSFMEWILPISAVILGLAAVLWSYRRFRLRREKA
jgi:hypothetical protein